MKVLKSWLNDWIDIEDIDSNDISDALESLGFEIESRTDKVPNYKNIVVGKKNLDISDKILKLLNNKIQKLDF